MVAQAKPINFIPNFLKNPVQNFVLESNAFSSPVAGQLRYDSSNNVPAWYNGSQERNLFSLTINELSNVKSYIDNLVAVNKVWKEVVLHENQLSSSNNSILQAIPFFLAGQPSANDTFILKDGTVTETFTFKASESVAFDVAIGGTVNISMSNLVQAINDDSTLWGAVLSTTLNSINSTDGRVIIIYRKDQALSSYTDRVYGSFTTPSNAKYINYNSQVDYDYNVVSNLPSSDPAVKTFGFGRITSALLNNETHQVRSNDSQYTWDSDLQAWNNTGTTGVTSTAPISVTAGVVSLNYAKGLEVTSGNLEVKLNSNSGLVKNAGVGSNELQINTDESTIERNSNSLRVKNAGITENHLASSVAGNGLTGGAGSPLAVGSGTGISVGADSISVDGSVVPRYYANTITGDGSTTIFTLTHNAGTNKAFVFVINNTTGDNEEIAWGRNSSDPTNKIDILFSPAPTNGLVYTVVVMLF